MSNPNQMPYLIKLLDDDSRRVREAVLEELAGFGSQLERHLAPYVPLDERRQEILQPLLEERRREWLRENWKSWHSLNDDKKRLEAALNLLAQFQLGPHRKSELEGLLDQLAHEFEKTNPAFNTKELAQFLFRKKNLQGAQEDYYNPLNSNLLYVLEEGRGIPISLVCVYILVAHRLKLVVEGCNFPGHFLARVTLDDQKYLVDCFNGGRFLAEKNLTALTSIFSSSADQIIRTVSTSTSIVKRTLHNLSHAYDQVEEDENRILMDELLQQM